MIDIFPKINNEKQQTNTKTQTQLIYILRTGKRELINVNVTKQTFINFFFFLTIYRM